MPTRDEAEATVRAALEGNECDADVVLAAGLFLEASAAGEEVHRDDLHISNTSLPVCENSHLPDNAPTTAKEAEVQAAAADADTGDACDASRGGTLSLCTDAPGDGGRGTVCVRIGEYTGPPRQANR